MRAGGGWTEDQGRFRLEPLLGFLREVEGGQREKSKSRAD